MEGYLEKKRLFFFSVTLFYDQLPQQECLERQCFTAHLKLKHRLHWSRFNVQRGCHGDVTGAK